MPEPSGAGSTGGARRLVVVCVLAVFYDSGLLACCLCLFVYLYWISGLCKVVVSRRRAQTRHTAYRAPGRCCAKTESPRALFFALLYSCCCLLVIVYFCCVSVVLLVLKCAVLLYMFVLCNLVAARALQAGTGQVARTP